MPTVDVVVETEISTSLRARQVGAMFDVPVAQKCRLEWKLDFPFDVNPWNVGLIVGPSGSGKSTVMRQVFGEPIKFTWSGVSMVDDFAPRLTMESITGACSAVGFNTIPAWMRPFSVLSNGEQFRADLARRLLEVSDPVVVDEFTSVVDRQVAQIASHAVQKFVRKNSRRLVAVTCHYDVVDWLQPDWVLDMATQSFTRRCLQRRPAIECVVGRLPYAAWTMFAPYHYMSAELNRAAQCFGLWVTGRLVAFAAVLHQPHAIAKNIKRISRVVTLPDWQGLGLSMVLIESLGAAYKALGFRLRNYPAHPAYMRTLDRSTQWVLKCVPTKPRSSSSLSTSSKVSGQGERFCAVFEYVGGAMKDVGQAKSLLGK